jgi:hypothetical protein
MSSTANLPAKWRAHGAFRPAPNCLGIFPGTGIHLLLSAASPAVVAGVVAELAVSVASNVIDAPLVAKPGVNRRSPAGFAGSAGNIAPASVAILNASPALDFQAAVNAAALARGVTRPLEIAWTRLETHSLANTPDAARRLHEVRDHFDAPLGLVIIIDDFAGERVGDAPLWRDLISIASVIPAPLLVVTARAPAEIDADAVLMRLDDKTFSVSNPAEGPPFQTAIEREGVEIGAETVPVVKFGARRAYAPPRRKPEAAATIIEVEAEPRKKPETVERIFLVQTGRQLAFSETEIFEGCRWTDDFLHAVKLGGQTVEDRATIVIVPSDRDPRREAASATAQRVKAQILSSGLNERVSVLVAPDMMIAA